MKLTKGWLSEDLTVATPEQHPCPITSQSYLSGLRKILCPNHTSILLGVFLNQIVHHSGRNGCSEPEKKEKEDFLLRLFSAHVVQPPLIINSIF